MSEWHVTQCDNCKLETQTSCPAGWLEIKKARLYGPWVDIERKNFCGSACFLHFIQKLQKQRRLPDE